MPGCSPTACFPEQRLPWSQQGVGGCDDAKAQCDPAPSQGAAPPWKGRQQGFGSRDADGALCCSIFLPSPPLLPSTRHRDSLQWAKNIPRSCRRAPALGGDVNNWEGKAHTRPTLLPPALPGCGRRSEPPSCWRGSWTDGDVQGNGDGAASAPRLCGETETQVVSFWGEGR